MKKISLYVFAALVFFFSTGIQETEASAWRDYSTGTELLEQGRVYEAIPYLERAVAESTNASYYRQLAEAYKLTNQFQKAAETLYAEAEIRYQIGKQTGNMNTYEAVLEMANRLNSEIELYTEKQVRPDANPTLEKYEPESGMYVGAFIEGDTPVTPYRDKKYQQFNALTDKKHATFFGYGAYGDPFPAKWASSVKNAGAGLHIAWEPTYGLDKVKDDAYLREFARDAKASGIPIFLRFASEMNGDWVSWHGDPAAYIRAFRTVSRVMSEEAPNVAMVWSPNSGPKHSINSYYPGDAYVDWVGVSIYNVRFFNGNPDSPADTVNPLDSLDYIYQEYADQKPIMISEYAATTYSKAGDMDTTEFAITKMKMLYHGVRLKYPRLKSVQWFSFDALENAREERQLNNYSLTENKELLNAYSNLVQHPYYLEEVVNGPFVEKGEPDSVDIVSLENEIIRNPKTVYAWAKTYDPNISKVVFKLNGRYIGERAGYPFSIEIDPGKLPGGKQELHASVFDSDGRKAIEKRVVFYTGESPSISNGEIVLYVNEPKAYTDNGVVDLLTAPLIKNGRTLVPIRFISETLGASVKWNNLSKTVTIESNGQTIQLTIDQNYAKVNGRLEGLDAAPIIVKGTTMVPIRFVTEQLQASISYESTTKKITIRQ